MSKAQDKIIKNTAGGGLMDKLMAGSSAFPGALKKGQRVEGKETSIGKKMVLVEIEAKQRVWFLETILRKLTIFSRN